MSRKYKALLAIFIPIMIITLLNFFYPLSFDILWGYGVAVALVFKSSLLSIWLASKLKILSFIKSLTLLKGATLTIKRWFIDNLLSKWLHKNIFSHLSEGLKELKLYYQKMSFKAKLKNTLFFLFPISIATWFMYTTQMLTHAALYAELKVLITGFFKVTWLLIAKLFSTISIMIAWIGGSWMAPVVEIFALSFLLEFVEKRLGKTNIITRFFTLIANLLNTLLQKIGLLSDKHITPFIEKSVVKKSQKLGEKLINYVNNKKIAQEFLYFDNLQNIILQGHIDAYHHFPDMQSIKDKKILYQRINQESSDNIDIIAYISRDKKGNLLEEDVPDDYYHDIFFLKGIASHQQHGVKNSSEIDRNDFWILNTSKYPLLLTSKNHLYHDREIKGHDIALIKTNHGSDFHIEDIICEYQNTKVSPTPISLL